MREAGCPATDGSRGSFQGTASKAVCTPLWQSARLLSYTELTTIRMPVHFSNAQDDSRIAELESALATDAALGGNSSEPIELSVILPTFQERENVPEVIALLRRAMAGIRWEAIFVDDDSPDGTAEAVLAHARQDARVRLIHRIGRRGLSSACVEGALASSAPWIAVMDADLQHDERVLPRMLQRAKSELLDLVVGTRHADGGSMGSFHKRRVLLSRLGRVVSQVVCRAEVSDPMSGFFLARRSFVVGCAPRLQRRGFKILLDLFASSERPVRFAEIGYRFRERRHGSSKLDVATAVEYLTLVVSKLAGDLLPPQLVVFALVGLVGMVVHLLALGVLKKWEHEPFFRSEMIATYLAMTVNFLLNNRITFHDRSLHGMRLLRGFASFTLVCSFGAWASVIFAQALLSAGMAWYVAGLSGMILSLGWNYSTSNLFTWRERGRVPVGDRNMGQGEADLRDAGAPGSAALHPLRAERFL